MDYFGDWAGNVYALDLDRHALQWAYRDGCKITASAAIAGGTVFVGDYAGSFAHRIVGVDGRTGRVVFRFPHGEYVAFSGNRGRLLLYGWASLWAVEARR